jgi:hypothetical protein
VEQRSDGGLFFMMKIEEVPFKVTVECRSAEAAKSAANTLKNFTKDVKDVSIKIVGTVLYMTFKAVRDRSLSILGAIKDLLGMSYTTSISAT